MSCFSRSCSPFVIFVACVLFAGCGRGDRPPLGSVSGEVKINGAPLSGVIVTFQPEKGRASEALTDAAGKFNLTYSDRVPGAKVGSHRVAFTWPLGVSGSHVIPARYAERTELACEVKPGQNSYLFELESDPGDEQKKPAPADD